MTPRERLPVLAKKGFTQAEAARELGISRQRVSQLAANMKLKFRPSVPEIPRQRQRLSQLAKKGLTRTEAARELGVSLERITRLAAEYGLTFASVWSRPRTPTTELGKVLQAARLACGFGYTRLAALSGLHRHHIAAIELGRVQRPTQKTLRALASSLRGKASYTKLVRAAYGRQAPPR